MGRALAHCRGYAVLITALVDEVQRDEVADSAMIAILTTALRPLLVG